MDTVSLRGVYTKEANEEAERLNHAKTMFLTQEGKTVRFMTNENTQTLYSLTIDPVSSSSKDIQGKSLNTEEVNYLLNLKSDDITLELLKEFFAYRKNNKPKFDIKDTFILKKGILKNKEDIKTTVGKFIFNKFVIDTPSCKFIDYINYPLHQKKIEKLENLMAGYLLEDKINSEEYADFLNRMIWLGYSMTKFLTTSMSLNLVMPQKKVIERKEQLIEQNKEKLKQVDLNTITAMEDELLDIASKELKDDPSIQLYDSGSRGGFGNNYKQSSVMRGIIKPVDPSADWSFSSSSLVEGIPPEELYAYADIQTEAYYSRAVATQDGGYESKKISSSMQLVTLDEKDTDCKTKKFLTILLNEENYDLFKYRFIITGNSLTMLDDDNKDKFINKVVNFRSPLFCTGDKICNACAGNLYYYLGIKNAGLTANVIGTTITNKALKKFHDLSIHLKTINLDDYISST